MAFGCHNCPHDAEIARLRETCLACRRCNGDRVKIGNWTRISIDNAKDETASALILSRTPPDYVPRKPSPRSRVDVPEAVRVYLLRAMEPFARLRDNDVLLVAAMMRGERLVDIARRTGESLQTVHARWKSLLRRVPIWEAIATGMIGSGRGRKPGKAKNGARPRGTSSGRGDDSCGGG
jgi:hypothetical protein